MDGYIARKNEVEQMNNKITINNEGKSNNADMMETMLETVKQWPKETGTCLLGLQYYFVDVMMRNKQGVWKKNNSRYHSVCKKGLS